MGTILLKGFIINRRQGIYKNRILHILHFCNLHGWRILLFFDTIKKAIDFLRTVQVFAKKNAF